MDYQQIHIEFEDLELPERYIKTGVLIPITSEKIPIVYVPENFLVRIDIDDVPIDDVSGSTKPMTPSKTMKTP